MQVIAKKKLYYGIIRHEGTTFELTSPDHFDARVHAPAEDAPTPKKAAKADDDADAKAKAAADEKAKADAEAQKAEAERLVAENAKAKADEGKGGNDTPQPTVRRRSTADKR